jgi:hypothetical protein
LLPVSFISSFRPTGILIERDGEVFGPAVRRLHQYYRFLKTTGLLQPRGATPAPVQTWELRGVNWQRVCFEMLGLKRTRAIKSHASIAKQDLARRTLLKYNVPTAIRKVPENEITDKLPKGLPTTNYMFKTCSIQHTIPSIQTCYSLNLGT